MLPFHFVKSMKKYLFTVVMMVVFSTSALADVPFPGKLPVEVKHVEAANIIHVNLETWPGFRRDIRIILPDLVLPAQGPEPKECEYALAQLAYEFTVNFLENAQDIRVNDMWMENSASAEAISSIHSKGGTLDNALRRERLARPADIAYEKPWC